MSAGISGKCKDCTKQDVRDNYQKNKPHYQAYDRARLHDPKRIQARVEHQKSNQDEFRAYKRNWAKRNPDKRKAQTAVGNAIRDGRLIPKPCERCGTLKTQGHHEDYSKPLEVLWLCTRCHADRHMELRDLGIEL